MIKYNKHNLFKLLVQNKLNVNEKETKKLILHIIFLLEENKRLYNDQ